MTNYAMTEEARTIAEVSTLNSYLAFKEAYDHKGNDLFIVEEQYDNLPKMQVFDDDVEARVYYMSRVNAILLKVL